jgi:membrane protease YdiL (CAAX protease family)
MLMPALILGLCGWVDLQWSPVGLSSLFSSLVLFAGVAVAEELLFRGFVFQRLIFGLGRWPAQCVTAIFSTHALE